MAEFPVRKFHPLLGEDGSPSVLGADCGTYEGDIAAEIEYVRYEEVWCAWYDAAVL